ncbi:MAG: hypothetical protein RLZZ556_453 [Actinomycetota bacterium]
MAKLSITTTALKFEIGVFEAIRAVRSSFEIPIQKVRGATDDSRYLGFSEVGLRSPGTGFPGLIAEGTFRKRGQKVLSLWRRGQQIVVIELDDSKWDRIILGCEDAKALAKQINSVVAT